MPMMTVAQAIAELQKLPPDAEMRCTRALRPDMAGTVNCEAEMLQYDEMGPLKYAEFVTDLDVSRRQARTRNPNMLLDFGEALRLLKQGHKLARAGWNGKGMYIYLEAGSTHFKGTGSERQYAPVVVLFTAQGHHQPGWVASQADMLAEDWKAVA